MIQAIAIDDEPPALKVIEHFSTRSGIIELQKTFTQPSEASKYLKKFPVDLLFLDIQMPSQSGIDFYKTIPQKCMVIFATAHSQYAVEGFNLNAVDYLLKPYTYDRFLQAINKANDYYQYQQQSQDVKQQYIYVRADYSLLKVAIADIVYIEGLDDYLKVHILNQAPIVARLSLKSLLEKLPAKEFIRVHRSFIVPASRITSVRNKTIYLGSQEIPIGASYEEAFFEQFKA